MSRAVPVDQALTDEDRHYLRQLGAHGQALEARLDEQFPPDSDAPAAFEKEERKQLAAMNGVGLNAYDQADLVNENERLKRELAELRGPAADKPDYTGWKKADLEAEVDRVNLEDPNAGLVKGTVADMSAALTAYFAE